MDCGDCHFPALAAGILAKDVYGGTVRIATKSCFERSSYPVGGGLACNADHRRLYGIAGVLFICEN